jgi:hypothetical protein
MKAMEGSQQTQANGSNSKSKRRTDGECVGEKVGNSGKK